MYKILCVAVLLLPTFARTQGTKSGSAGTFTSPQIVVKGKLTNQTAPIPTTTIFTPVQTGLYRLTVYATVSRTDSNSGSLWFYSFGWTDGAGTEYQSDLLFQGGNTPGPFVYQFMTPVGGTVFPFEGKAGTPVTYNMTQSGPPDNSAYNLYYTIERLE